MKSRSAALANSFSSHARRSLRNVYLPRIQRCLNLLSQKDIWWRPNRASNGAGNLVLHLSGNVRQWIVSGLGGVPDRRNRDWEFAARGPISRRGLLTRLRASVAEADKVLKKLSPRDLSREYVIQGFRVTGLKTISHVVEHFAYHTGQIIFVTKLKHGRDLGLTRLPSDQARHRRGSALPAV